MTSRLFSLSLVSLLLVALACGDDDGFTPVDTGSDSGFDTGSDTGFGVDTGGGGGTVCSEECEFTGDGECDDGGEGSVTSICALGTDCLDCGPRTGGECVPSCGGNICGGDGCGGSCGMCGMGERCVGGDCESSAECSSDAECDSGERCSMGSCVTSGECFEPFCEGDIAVSCELIRGTPATIRETCRGESRCAAGECVGIPRPTSVTISTNYGDVDPVFSGEAPTGFLGVSGPPRFSVELPSGLRLFDAASRAVVTSPALAGCEIGDPAMTLNSSSVSAQVIGSGPACVGFLTNAASRGISYEIPEVEYVDGRGTVDVTLDFRP